MMYSADEHYDTDMLLESARETAQEPPRGNNAKVYRYYTIFRPPGPGAVPSKGLVRVAGFDDRVHVPSQRLRVWGWAEYNRKLTEREISQYELGGSDEFDADIPEVL